MFKDKAERTAPGALTAEQLELASGGGDGSGNIPICPPWTPGHPGLPPGIPVMPRPFPTLET
jgi:hypothetical protein